MTDEEILKLISNIKPSTYRQWQKLSKCMLIWMEDNKTVDYTDEYVSMLTDADVLNKACRTVYTEYVDWCRLNHVEYIVHINTFSKYLAYKLNVSSKLIRGRKCYCR